MSDPFDPPDDETPVHEELPHPVTPAPAAEQLPDFEAMLGSYQELALFAVVDNVAALEEDDGSGGRRRQRGVDFVS